VAKSVREQCEGRIITTSIMEDAPTVAVIGLGRIPLPCHDEAIN